MGYYLKSVGLFSARWAKYAWPLLVFVAVDAADLWKSHIEAYLPPDWQGLSVPTPLFVLGMVVTGLWIAGHVFYEVRKDRDDKAKQLEDSVDEEAVASLAELFKEVANDIWNADVENDRQLREWFDNWERWHAEVVDILKDEFPGGTAELFDTVGFLDTPPIAGGYNEEHNEKLRTVMWKMKRLREIIDEYSRPVA